MESLANAIFEQHWEKIVIVAMWIATIINGHTPEWKAWPGRIGKALGLAVKVLGLWTADKPQKWEPGDPDRRGLSDAKQVNDQQERQANEQRTQRIAASLLVALVVSCANPSQTAHETLDAIHIAGVHARETGLPVVNQVCLSHAEACARAGTVEADCDMYQKCKVSREQFAQALRAVQLGFVAGKLALAASDETDAQVALQKTVASLAEARHHAQSFIEGLK